MGTRDWSGRRIVLRVQQHKVKFMLRDQLYFNVCIMVLYAGAYIFKNFVYLFGIVSVKRDLIRYFKIFKEGASKLTRTCD